MIFLKKNSPIDQTKKGVMEIENIFFGNLLKFQIFTTPKN